MIALCYLQWRTLTSTKGITVIYIHRSVAFIFWHRFILNKQAGAQAFGTQVKGNGVLSCTEWFFPNLLGSLKIPTIKLENKSPGPSLLPRGTEGRPWLVAVMPYPAPGTDATSLRSSQKIILNSEDGGLLIFFKASVASVDHYSYDGSSWRCHKSHSRCSFSLVTFQEAPNCLSNSHSDRWPTQDYVHARAYGSWLQQAWNTDLPQVAVPYSYYGRPALRMTLTSLTSFQKFLSRATKYRRLCLNSHSSST